MIFARGAHIEARHKRFHSALDRSGNVVLAKSLNQKTIKVCDQTGLPYYHIDQSQQKGSNFGDRLTHAFKQIFEKGFENVIAIGNDCPDLEVNDLILADQSLTQGKNVLGPAEDGGVYLIGLNLKNFSSKALEGINWKTSNVFKQLLRSIKDPVRLLVQKFDIDGVITKKVVKRFGNSLYKLWRLITQLLIYFKPRYQPISIPVFLSVILTLRGPPSYC